MPTFPTPRDALFGNPATADHKPDKGDLRAVLEQMQTMFAAGTIKGFAPTVAALPASGNAANDLRIVVALPQDGGGVYQWSGSAWALVAALPVVFTTDQYALLAQAWAESATSPDGEAGSKSAKTWAIESAGSATASAASASQANTFATQAELAAIAAGAPIVSSLTSPVPADGTVELLKLDAGLQVHEVVAGAWVLRGWLVGPTFDTVALLLASTATTLGATGQIVEAGGFRYEVVASGGDVITLGGVRLRVLAGADGRISWRALGASETATSAENTAAFIAAAAIGLPLTLGGISSALTAAVTVTAPVFGPGKLMRDSTMLIAGANGIAVDGVEFEGTATSGTIAPIAVSAINRSGITVKNCTLTNCRVTVRNTALSHQTDFRFQNNKVSADFTLIEHIINQNDVITVRGVDGIWITDNNFTVLNVHRVFKIADTEAATTSGTDFRARSVFVTGNRINGSTDSGKQVFDLFFFTSDFIAEGNQIEVTGFSSIFENKTGLAANYNQNTTIKGNPKLSNNSRVLEFQGAHGAINAGADVGFQNLLVEGNTIISTASSASIANRPMQVRFYDTAQIIGNTFLTPAVFLTGLGVPAVEVTSCAHSVVNDNTIERGAILFTTATTNHNAEPFSAPILSIQANDNTIMDFGGSAILGGIYVLNVNQPNARVQINCNYIRQSTDDAASAGLVAVTGSALAYLQCVANIGVMALASEQRLRLLTNTISVVQEKDNSWNLIGRAVAVYDPPSIAAGAVATTTITVTGAAVAQDFVTQVFFSRALAGLQLTAWVSGADTVTVQFYNPTAGAVDLASGNLRVEVSRFTDPS